MGIPSVRRGAGDHPTAEGGTGVPAPGAAPPSKDDSAAGALDAAERDAKYRLVRRHALFALVWLIVAVGMIRIAQYHWRQGAALVGGALLVAAAARAMLASDQVGLIAVRGRASDVLSYAGLGTCVLFIALTIEGGPFG